MHISKRITVRRLEKSKIALILFAVGKKASFLALAFQFTAFQVRATFDII